MTIRNEAAKGRLLRDKKSRGRLCPPRREVVYPALARGPLDVCDAIIRRRAVHGRCVVELISAEGCFRGAAQALPLAEGRGRVRG